MAVFWLFKNPRIRILNFNASLGSGAHDKRLVKLQKKQRRLSSLMILKSKCLLFAVQ
jgi:hypothetical protein